MFHLLPPTARIRIIFYHIDTATKAWVDDGKQGTIKIAKPVDRTRDSLLNMNSSMQKELSPAWKRFHEIMHRDDTILFRQRFYDTAFCQLYRTSDYYNDKYKRFVRVSFYKKENSFSKKSVKGENWFNVKNVNLYNTNPELRAFNGMTWVCDGPETPREFSAKYLRKKKYSDVRIERNGDSFTILLKEQKGIMSIQAHPVSKYAGTENAAKTYDRRYKNYVKALARRESDFNKRIFQSQQQVYKSNLKIWTKLKPVMSDSEKTMTYDNWLKYYYRMVVTDTLSQYARTVNSLNSMLPVFRRNMSITQFGYYNCDQPVKQILALPVNAIDAIVRFGYKTVTEPKQYATIQVTYTNGQNRSIVPKQVMIIDKRIKSVAYVDNGTTMTIAVNSTKNLIAVMPDGAVGLFSENDFKTIDLREGSAYNFTLKMYNPSEFAQLKTILGKK